VDHSIIDYAALLTSIVIALAVGGALLYADRDRNKRRGWIVAGMLTAVMAILGVLDLMRETPRETHIATAFAGAIIPVLGSLAIVWATRGVRAWIRIPVVLVTTYLLLFAGLLVGATFITRFL